MKRCPQCNSVFDDSLVYCTNDGTPLLEETFVMPSEASPQTDAEEETVIHHDPITIEIRHHEPLQPTEQFNYQAPPPVETVIVEKRRNTGKYVLFLFLGLVMGGGMVLAAVLFTIFLSQRNNQPSIVNTANQNSAPTPKTTSSPTPITASAKHEKRTDKPDVDFNGRVISKNAYVRSSPNKNSKQVDVLPVDDRLEIAERASPSSPWFRVTCEHGTTGWMHGNTIKYTDTDSGF